VSLAEAQPLMLATAAAHHFLAQHSTARDDVPGMNLIPP
jgi:hypothetical protein